MKRVLDNGVTFEGAGTIAGASSATKPWTSVGDAYLTLNASPDNTNSVYVGATGVTSSDGFPLWPGQSRTWRAISLAAVYVYVSTGDSCGWIVER